MKKSKTNDIEKISKRSHPAITPEARENQMIALAIDLAEEQLRNGTASSQVITHYLKLGTTISRLELEKIKNENELLKAKTESLQKTQNIDRLYSEAIDAMKRYSGGNMESTCDD